ncbi:unnamed protein product, partial [Laminaria digitata]
QVAFKLPPRTTPVEPHRPSPLALTRKRRRSWSVKQRVVCRGPPLAPRATGNNNNAASGSRENPESLGQPQAGARGGSLRQQAGARGGVGGQGRGGGVVEGGATAAAAAAVSSVGVEEARWRSIQQAFVVGPVSRYTALYFDEEIAADD